ncbi:MAG: PEP-CTERM sorting domain-containing protein [Gemmatirosa sp.]|nr:PEP-CTERM sorting domain-containing protein [Gemmatirosa sp.]
MRASWIAAALTVVALAQPASAQPTVDYTVTGTPGDWWLSFTVSNTIPPQYHQTVYFFGVALGASGSIVGYPTPNWGSAPPYSPIGEGGSSTLYTVNWAIDPLSFGNQNDLIGPGESLGGFDAHTTAFNKPTTVQWIAASFDLFDQNTTPVPGTYSQPPYDTFNPGFEGVASGVSVAPEPGTWALLGTGLLALGGVVRRRRTS